jgi:hypothetical protein
LKAMGQLANTENADVFCEKGVFELESTWEMKIFATFYLNKIRGKSSSWDQMPSFYKSTFK